MARKRALTAMKSPVLILGAALVPTPFFPLLMLP